MKIIVKVGNHTYHVNVGMTNIRPIIVEVDGDQFEVWPELVSDINTSLTVDRTSINSHFEKEVEKSIGEDKKSLTSTPRLNRPELITPLQTKIIRAPIPGVITAVYVNPGSEVTVGAELLKLEAMKMNNSIRSNRAGVIRDVHIAVGQVVKNNEILLEFAG